MAPTVQLPHPFTSIDAYLNHLVEFLQTHAWLFRNHVVDFVTLDHWQHMPEQWRKPLLECSTAELLCLPVGVCPARADAAQDDGGWPQSLVEFIRGASNLALPRVPACDQPTPKPVVNDTSGTGLESLGSEPGVELAAHKDSSALSKALSRGMKAKKRHEVERLGALVASLCERLGCQTVVDFGAGQGYLGQLLHFGYGLRVVAIDSSAHQTHGADRRAARVKKALTKRPTAPPAHAAAVATCPEPQSEAAVPPIAVDASALFAEETVADIHAPRVSLDATTLSPSGTQVPEGAVCHGCGVGASNCSGATPSLKPCTLCGEVFYCSKACQKLSWKKLKHKVHCKGMAKHRAAAAAEKAKQEAARAAEDESSATVDGVYSITCLLDQRLTTLPSLLSKQPAAVTESATAEGGFLLLGLHTCGDLTPSMLRVFGKPSAWSSNDSSTSGWGQPAAIVNVGCCYHLLTEAEERGKVGSDGRSVPNLSDEIPRGSSGDSKDAQGEGEDGFPLSSRVSSLGLSLGIGARMLACQAVERWPTKGEVERSATSKVDTLANCKNEKQVVGPEFLSQKLGEADLMFRKHFYRGVLQCILEERFAEQRPTEGKSVSKDNGAIPSAAGELGTTAGAGAGGPPTEAMHSNREVGWVVGAQKKITAAAAAVTTAGVSANSSGVEDGGDDTVAAGGKSVPRRTQAEAGERHGSGTSPGRLQGKGKSWDQVVNSKVRSGSFVGYAAAALQRLGLETMAAGKITQVELEEYERRHSHRRKQIAVFWTIRAVLAPLLEGLLLLDRTLYLHDECSCGV